MTNIIVIGTYDTKAKPLKTLEQALIAAGERPVTIDTGIFSTDVDVTYSGSDVAKAAGVNLQDLSSQGRAKSVRIMAEGAANILGELVSNGSVGAVVMIGGSNASSVFTHLVPKVPLGIPKLLMATTVSGDVRTLVDGADTMLFYPIVDVDGDNSILRAMIKRLADTAAVVKSDGPINMVERERRVALSMYGVTTPCVQLVERQLRLIGVEPLVFHANGAGGATIERFARQYLINAIADLTLAELSNEVVGGAYPAGRDRMTAASCTGIPQVIAPGSIDMVAFGPGHTMPKKFKDHLTCAHNDLVTLVRTTPNECYQIGKKLAERLGAPKADTVVCVPLGGTSMMDQPGEVFYNPEAVRAFHDGLKDFAASEIQIETSPKNINDPDFAARIFSHLVMFLEMTSTGQMTQQLNLRE